MAKVSSNEKGNKYHDEETGEFTTTNGGGVKTAKIQLKGDIDINKLKENIEALKNPLEHDFDVPKTLVEAENIGNRILGSKVNAVGYDDSTDLMVAHNFNLALKDSVKMFPKLFTNDKIISYGTKSKVNLTQKSEFDRYMAIVTEPEYAQRFQFVGVDPKAFINELSSITMNTARDFNAKDLPDDCGGLTAFRNANKFIVLTNSIKFNKKHSTSMQNWDAYQQDGVRKGAFFNIKKGGAYATASHELGHHIFNMLKGFMTQGEFNYLRKNIMPGEYFFFKGDISGYAASSFDEQIAEACSDYFGNENSATQHNKDIVKFLKIVYDRVYGGN